MAGGEPLAGIGQYMCGERWVFPKPIRAGDVLWSTQSLFSAELKPSYRVNELKDGRVTDGREHFHDLYAWDEFWA